MDLVLFIDYTSILVHIDYIIYYILYICKHYNCYHKIVLHLGNLGHVLVLYFFNFT